LCVITILSDEEWEGRCRIMEKEKLIHDRRFAILSDRKKHEFELDRLVEEWTVKFDANEIMVISCVRSRGSDGDGSK
jgi:crotonobetainyl-CoA:carnitine CoA-transferase CaiB-like acyl-CoA transferase